MSRKASESAHDDEGRSAASYYMWVVKKVNQYPNNQYKKPQYF